MIRFNPEEDYVPVESFVQTKNDPGRSGPTHGRPRSWGRTQFGWQLPIQGFEPGDWIRILCAYGRDCRSMSGFFCMTENIEVSG